MGVVNVTPDSFSGAGMLAPDAALSGADIIDVGGESTRPGAAPVLPGVEQARILPLIAALAGQGVVVSVDTRNASTMAAALDAGARIVNDVSGLTHDPDSASLVARRGCPVVLMHMRGTPQSMASLAQYGDVVADVLAELSARVDAALQAGIARENIAIDPGIGFAKTPAQNLALLRGLHRFAALGLPVLVGVSRKSFVGIYGGEADPARRLPGSLAAGLFALSQGAAILRVHDVAETVQAVRVWRALADSGTQVPELPGPVAPA
jgi:dihydropteroate synthase